MDADPPLLPDGRHLRDDGSVVSARTGAVADAVLAPQLQPRIEPFGMHAKIFTFKQMGGNMDHRNDKNMSALIIALSAEEAEWLKRQPVLQQGHTSDCAWGLWCCPAHDGSIF